MMPIEKFDEPTDFDRLVRQRGLEFLSRNPNPTTSEWSKKAYWQKILPEMRILYGKVCNYCSTYIKHSTGAHSVDHFIDKASTPASAYEWSNYRYVSSRFNSRKGVRKIIDPIGLAPETFQLNLTNFFVETNPDLEDKEAIQLAKDTIEILAFNSDNVLVDERAEFYFDYISGEISFSHLQKQAPFIAYEINRQGLRTR